MQMRMGGLPTSRLFKAATHRISGPRNRAPILLPGAIPRDRGDPPPSAASQWSFAPANNPKASLIPSSEAFSFWRCRPLPRPPHNCHPRAGGDPSVPARQTVSPGLEPETQQGRQRS